ncbi:MAG: hypothetical protein J6O50_09105 [Ruminiclostridium sp.]|nr:hypothetical protein [Ruminiclostridium sp.]
MKAVILERKGDEAAVLAENGSFMKIKHSGSVGEEIEIAPNVTPMPRPARKWVKGLAAAALILAVSGGAYHYTAVSVSAYVSIDAGDSSIEVAVNRLGRVLSVEAVNDSDSGLAEAIGGDIRGMKVEDGVAAALGTLVGEGRLSAEDELMIVGITSDSDSSAESLEKAIVQNVDLPVRTVRVSGGERKEAHEKDIGGGRYVYERSTPVTSAVRTAEVTDTTAASGIPGTTSAISVSDITEAIAEKSDIPADTTAIPEPPESDAATEHGTDTADIPAAPERQIPDTADTGVLNGAPRSEATPAAPETASAPLRQQPEQDMQTRDNAQQIPDFPQSAGENTPAPEMPVLTAPEAVPPQQDAQTAPEPGQQSPDTTRPPQEQYGGVPDGDPGQMTGQPEVSARMPEVQSPAPSGGRGNEMPPN